MILAPRLLQRPAGSIAAPAPRRAPALPAATPRPVLSPPREPRQLSLDLQPRR